MLGATCSTSIPLTRIQQGIPSNITKLAMEQEKVKPLAELSLLDRLLASRILAFFLGTFV